MTTKDITRKAAQEAAERENTARQEQTERDQLQTLQKQAATALNDLLTELRKQHYMVFNTILLLGIAFEVKKDENLDFYFVPSDLTQSDIYKKEFEDEQSEAEVIQESLQGIQQAAEPIAKRRNITSNRGRSVEAGRNDNTHFRG